MDSKIELYKFGVVKDIKNNGEGLIDLTILVEDTKKHLILTMDNREVDIEDEVEFIFQNMINQKGELVTELKGRHNITKQAIEKIYGIQFPIEVLNQGHELNNHDRRLLRLHKLYMNSIRFDELYRKYLYVSKNGGSIGGAISPNVTTFKTSKSFFDNARNIYYLYYIIRAKETILEQHNEGILDIGLFDSIKKSFYNEFVMDIKDISGEYQSIENFEKHLADTRDKVGL